MDICLKILWIIVDVLYGDIVNYCGCILWKYCDWLWMCFMSTLWLIVDVFYESLAVNCGYVLWNVKLIVMCVMWLMWPVWHWSTEFSPTERFGGDVHIVVIWPRGGSAEIRWDVHIDVRASVDRRAGCEFPVFDIWGWPPHWLACVAVNSLCGSELPDWYSLCGDDFPLMFVICVVVESSFCSTCEMKCFMICIRKFVKTMILPHLKWLIK